MRKMLTQTEKQLVTIRRMLWLVAISVVISLGFGPAQASDDAAPRVITVVGEGRIAAVPDMAVITVGVGARAKQASEALDLTSVAMTDMIEALQAAGIADRDIQTSGVSLRPLHDRKSSGSYAEPPDGFEASNRLVVRVRNLAATGEILDVLVREKGANRIDNIRFTLSDPVPLQDEARRAAVADALARANLYAESAGVTLGQVLSIDEHGSGGPVPMEDAAFASARAAVPVAAGELQVTQSVTIRYQID